MVINKSVRSLSDSREHSAFAARLVYRLTYSGDVVAFKMGPRLPSP
jgi:hypothetical protein